VAFRDLIRRGVDAVLGPAPMPSASSPDGGFLVTSSADLDEALRRGMQTESGAFVNADTAMRQPVVIRCVAAIAGAVAKVPMQVKRRVDDRTRVDASDTAIWNILNRRPNRWQKPAQFKRMMQAHVLLRGNAYALKVKGALGELKELIPLHPDRVDPRQRDDLMMEFHYTRKDGRLVIFQQEEILHLFGLSLDGIKGVSVITYARETLGDAAAMAKHGSTVFRNGANVSGALKHQKRLTEEQHARLRADMQDFRQGGARNGETIILEEGMDYIRLGMSAEDTQWMEARKYTRTEIMMLFGVPPFIVGDTEKSTSWGTGLEQQKQGFADFTLEDQFIMWEEGVNIDCIDAEADPNLYMRFNRNAYVRGDFEKRWNGYVKALQWGVFSPNKVLELEDENPREGGDIYYDPPNMAGGNGGDANPTGGQQNA